MVHYSRLGILDTAHIPRSCNLYTHNYLKTVTDPVSVSLMFYLCHHSLFNTILSVKHPCSAESREDPGA